MIPRSHHIEVLAQALWLRYHGEKRILAEWREWSAANKTEADAFRARADEMLGVHEGRPKNQPGSSTTHHSSLGWLY